MTLVLNLPPDLEARLQAAAQKQGTHPSECAVQVLDRHLPLDAEVTSEDPTIALLRKWRQEDATDDAEEIQRAEAELEELKSALNANREAGGTRLLFP